MKNAIIYARYSSEKQNDQSIESQIRICQQYAEQNGLTIVDTYIDRATTGTNDQRPAFQQMLADCAKPVPWDIVLVYAIDRFGRNSIEIAVNKQKLKKNHKTLISATQRTSENIDGSKNLDGILLENVYIGLAEYYSAELSQKVLRGMYENRKKGLFCGGQISFGYRVENKKVLVNEDEAAVVRYIFQQYADGKVAREIIQDLTNKGILYQGKAFIKNTFYDLLRAERYIGIYRHGDEVYTNRYPPIIPKPLFDEVQRILAKNKIGSASRRVNFLLKGKLYCAYCGKKMNGESGTSLRGSIHYYYYKCSTRKKHLNPCNKESIKKDLLENLILKTTLSVLNKPENLTLIADEVIKVHEKRIYDKSVLNILEEERTKVKKTLSNIMKAIEEGIFTATTKARMEELEQRLSEIEEKILIEQYSLQSRITREQVIEYLSHALQKFPQLLIQTLIHKIVLFDDKVEIYYNYVNTPNPDDPPTDDRRDLFWNINSSTLFQNGAPSLNSLNFFTVKKTFGLFCFIEEFENFRA